LVRQLAREAAIHSAVRCSVAEIIPESIEVLFEGEELGLGGGKIGKAGGERQDE
jgi:hypothetical protein